MQLIDEFINRAYGLYPRKLGKSDGIKKLQKDLKTEADCKLFFMALNRFIEHHKKVETEPCYIPYFSTFVSTWRDWLDPLTGASTDLRGDVKELFQELHNDETRVRDGDDGRHPLLRQGKV